PSHARIAQDEEEIPHSDRLDNVTVNELLEALCAELLPHERNESRSVGGARVAKDDELETGSLAPGERRHLLRPEKRLLEVSAFHGVVLAGTAGPSIERRAPERPR